MLDVGYKKGGWFMEGEFHSIVADAQTETFFFTAFKFNYLMMLEWMVQLRKSFDLFNNPFTASSRDAGKLFFRSEMK